MKTIVRFWEPDSTSSSLYLPHEETITPSAGIVNTKIQSISDLGGLIGVWVTEIWP